MTVRDYLELRQIDRKNYAGDLSYYIDLVSIYLDMDPDKVAEDLSIKEIRSKVDSLHIFLKNLKYSNEIKVEETSFKFKPFEEMTLGEFIDLENYLVNNEVTKILAILYRKCLNETFLDKKEWESYSKVDIDARSKHFLDVDASEVCGIIDQAASFRNKIITGYTNLWNNEPLEDEEMLDGLQKSQLEQARKNHEKFAWESFILFLANDDVTKFNDVCDLPVILAFNIASYRKSVINNNKR